ncbi:RimK/LysX family protein [Rapidithrix thailandica]|uniref:RimK/LysX family protein n=1 Tax=Rapidithrix thailandica TaxID=413964 RepID=A0AAW9RUL4_9BACT
MPHKIIGRKDRIDLPEFNLNNLDAKIDTGAYGCAIHCHHIELVLRDGKEILRFKLLDPSHPEYEGDYYYSHSFGIKKVKNTSGVSEERFTIKTQMIVFGKSYRTVFSLADRENMKYPVLIGRKFLTKKFLVDVALKDLSFQNKTHNHEHRSLIEKPSTVFNPKINRSHQRKRASREGD